MKAFSRNYPPPQNKQTTTHRELQNLLTFHKPIPILLFINSILECLQPLILHFLRGIRNIFEPIFYTPNSLAHTASILQLHK